MCKKYIKTIYLDKHTHFSSKPERESERKNKTKKINKMKKFKDSVTGRVRERERETFDICPQWQS